MKHSTTFYKLSCLNVQCLASIYWENIEIRIPFTAENLAKTFICMDCHEKLFASKDVEIERTPIKVVTKTARQRYHISSN